MPRIGEGYRSTLLPSSYTDPVAVATQGQGRNRLWSRGSDSTGQLVIAKGAGTNESPYEGFVFGWCGGTGAAMAILNQIRIRIPRGQRNWMRIKSVRITPTCTVAGCDFTPTFGISDGATNTDQLALAEEKISTIAGQDNMVWECDALFRIDTGIDDTIADSMSNLLPLTGTDPHPCISIASAGFAGVTSFNFMVQLEWVEL